MPRPPRDTDRSKPRRAPATPRAKSPAAAARDARRAAQHAADKPEGQSKRPAAHKFAGGGRDDAFVPRVTAERMAREGRDAPRQATGRIKPGSADAARPPRRQPTDTPRPARVIGRDARAGDRDAPASRPTRGSDTRTDRPRRVNDDAGARTPRAAFSDRASPRGERAFRQDSPRPQRAADAPRAARGPDRASPHNERAVRPDGPRPRRDADAPRAVRPFDRAPSRGDRAFGRDDARATRDASGPRRADRADRFAAPDAMLDPTVRRAYPTRAARAAALGHAPRGETGRRGAARHDRPAAPARAPSAAAPGEGQRIAKLLARAGVASRREIERMIVEGRVAIAGVPIDTPATILRSLHQVTVDGQPVQAAAPARLFRYHKPAGLLTAERDPAGRATIYDRLPQGLPRVMPVGRLDLNTEGLLLLTTDGEFKRELELPATGVERSYRARVFGDISQAQLEALIDGIEIEGVRYGSIDANLERRTGRNGWLEMRLREGKNREVRRVLEHLGLQVSRLIRTAYGPFRLDDMPPGEVDEVRQHDLVEFRKSLR